MATDINYLLANHFDVKTKTEGFFYQYHVSITHNDCHGSPLDFGKKSTLSRRIIQAINLEKGRNAGMYFVKLKHVSKIPIQAAMSFSERYQEAVRVLDIILSLNAAQKGCLQVRQSYFHNHVRNFVDLGGGLLGCRGFRSSFRPKSSGLSLNMDASTTIIVKPGPVIDFLLLNQSIENPADIDWVEAKKTLMNLRIKSITTNREYKIKGLTDLPCRDQMLSLQQRRGTFAAQEVDITVYDYFVNHREVPLKFSEMPCLCVGKPNNHIYIPIELCTLVPLQRYTKALSNLQRTAFLEASQQKPLDRRATVNNALTCCNYAANSLLQSSGVLIDLDFTSIRGRVLNPPKLSFGNGQEFDPIKGKWNFNNKKLVEPVTVNHWGAVSFSAHCNLENLCMDMAACWKMKGFTIGHPSKCIEETQEFRGRTAPIRVNKMFEKIKTLIPTRPDFILCVLPEKKRSNLYGPWKKLSFHYGMVTQCIAPPAHINNQYKTNVLLKINAKLGGLNSLLTMEHRRSMPEHMVFRVPTLIVGMSVSHGSPGRNVPSVAAVIGSRQWPLISKYRAAVRSQLPRSSMIDGLFKPISSGSKTDNKGMFRELLTDFCESSKCKPKQIIIFRNGVSESQFKQVLDVELEQIIEACRSFDEEDEEWNPKFLLAVAQRSHRTKFFHEYSRDNFPTGTVIDETINHPTDNDFYMCAHASMIGTTRPTRYIILKNDIGYSSHDFQELVHSLSYVYQRGTTAISVAAPLYYARLAAAQISQCIEFGEMSEAKFPVLHEDIRGTMFFC